MPPSSSISKGSKPLPRDPRRMLFVGPIVLSGGRRLRTTARPSTLAMLAFKNLDDREVAEIA